MVSVTHTSRGERPERRRAISLRMRLAVEGLLEEDETFTEISVARLVERAGLSRSTFYVYFEDKGSLLLDISAAAASEVLAAGSSWWGRSPGLERDELRSALAGVISAYRGHCRLLAAVAQTASYDPAVRRAYDANVESAADAIAGHIRAGQRDSTMAAGLDPDGVAAWLAWMIERGLHKRVDSSDELDADALVEALTSLIWNALYAS